jgi:multidrug efflux pump subunit AcrA (membrane-fusion protein)
MAQKGPIVFVAKPDDTVELRQVTLGQRQGDDVVVTNGVASGERVVVTGQLTLSPGAKVHPVPASTTAPAGNPGSNGSAQQ